MLAIFIVAFVITGGIVGYLQEIQNSASVIYPIAAGFVPTIQSYGPGAQVTMLSTTAAANAPTGYTTSFGGRMIEIEGYMTIEVLNPNSALSDAMSLAYSLGGYVASSSTGQTGGASMVVRVPQGNFSLAMHKLAAFGTVRAQSISSNDVSEQYVNLQAQLDAYETEAATLLRILNSSRTVSDALATEDTLQQVQGNINQIEGQLQVMQRLVAFSTLNVDFLSPNPEPALDFGEALRSAIMSFYIVAKGMLIVGGAIAPFLMIGAVAYYPYKRFSKKKEKEAKPTGTG
jgi:hypothetical protein